MAEGNLSQDKSTTDVEDFLNLDHGKKVNPESGDSNNIETEVESLVQVKPDDNLWKGRKIDWGIVNLTAESSQLLPTYQGKNIEIFFPVRSLMNKIVATLDFQRQTENSDCDASIGTYLNLCGECVGGTTEKDPDFGVDSCGVCGGRCKDNSSCPTDAVDEITNCTRLERVEPTVIDLAADSFKGFLITATGDCPGNCYLPNHECYFTTENDTILNKKFIAGGMSDKQFYLNMTIPKEEGTYKLCCIGDKQWCQTIIVVNSFNLNVLSSGDPINLGKEQQVVLGVSNVAAPVGLVCYAKSNSKLQLAEFSHNLYGNKLNTKIVCPSFFVSSVNNVTAGVAYTFEALSKMSGIELKVNAEPPKMVSATLSRDMMSVVVEFNQNIQIRPTNYEKIKEYDPVITSCSEIFSPNTLALFSRGTSCEVFLNKVTILTKNILRIRDGSIVQLRKDNVLTPLGSPQGPQAADLETVRIKVPAAKQREAGRVIIEEKCDGTVRAAVVPYDPTVAYRWSLIAAENEKIISSEIKRSLNNLTVKKGSSIVKRSLNSGKQNTTNNNISQAINSILETTTHPTTVKRATAILETGVSSKSTENKMLTTKNVLETTTHRPTEKYNIINSNPKESKLKSNFLDSSKHIVTNLVSSNKSRSTESKVAYATDRTLIKVKPSLTENLTESNSLVKKLEETEKSSEKKELLIKLSEEYNEVKGKGNLVDNKDSSKSISSLIFPEDEDSANGKSQKKNLMIWKSIRNIEKTWRQGSHFILINKTQLMSGVDYYIQVEAVDLEGGLEAEGAEMRAHLRTDNPNAGLTTRGRIEIPKLQIVAPLTTDPMQPLIMQAKMDCLKSPPINQKFIWSIESNGMKVPSDIYQGSLLKLPPGYLKPRSFYNISSVVVDNSSNIFAQGSTIIYADMPKMKFNLLVKEIVIGTGHPIQVDASKAAPFGLSGIQIEWKCERRGGGECIKPGSNREPVPLQYGNQLNYPRGTLPVGEYIVTARAMWGGDEEVQEKNEIKVRVVRGDTPWVGVTQTSSGSLIGLTRGVTPGCLIAWRSISTPGFQAIEPQFTNSLLVDATSSSDLMELSAANGNLLKPDTNYKLSFAVECREGSSSLIVEKLSQTKFPALNLVVNPESGSSFKTKFTYSVHGEQTMAQEYLEYKYGYQNKIGDVKILQTSPEAANFSTYLPAVSGLKPVFQVCNAGKVCKTILAKELKVTPSSVFSEEAISEVLETLEGQVKSGDFESAIGSVTLLADASNSYTELISNRIEIIFTEAITSASKWFETKHGQEWGGRLLELMTSSDFLPKGESFTTKLLQFRDSLSSAINDATKFADKQNPSKLPAEPRQIKRPKRSVRFKRQDTDSQILVKTFLTTSEWVIMNSKNLTKITLEKSKLTENIPNYITELCNDAADSTPLVVEAKLAVISGEKVSITGQKQELKIPPCLSSCRNETLQVVFGRQIFDTSKLPDGVCLGGSYFQTNLLEETYLIDNLLSVSGVYRVEVLPYRGSLVSHNEADILGKKLLLLRIPLRQISSKEIQCQSWTAGKWSSNNCRTLRQITFKGITSVECKCPIPGYYRLVSPLLEKVTGTPKDVTEVTTKARNSNVTVVEGQVYLYTLTFIIEESYSKEVNSHKEKFDLSIREQINTQTSLPEDSDVYTIDKEGNILVVVRAIDKWIDSETHFVPTLGRKLSKGELMLKGLSGNNLTLDRMTVNVTKFQLEENVPPPILLTMITTVFSVTALVAVVISVAAYMHWRKDQRVPNFGKNFEAPKPRYLRLHDEASIENIEHAVMSGRAVIDSGVILSVGSMKQINEHSSYPTMKSDVSLPGTTGGV